MSLFNKILLFLCVAVVTVHGVISEDFAIEDTGCGGNFTNSTGALNFTAGVNQTCVWFINRSGNASQETTLYFSEVNISDPNTSLSVFSVHDNISSVIALFGSKQGPAIVVSFSNVTKVVLVTGNQNTSAAFQMKYDTNKCSMSIDSTSLHGELSSPLYLPGSGTLNCTITVETPSTQDTPVITFTDYAITDGSLSITTDKSTNNVTADPADIFFEAGTSKFEFNLFLNTTSNNTQGFNLSYFSVTPACSGALSASDQVLNLVWPRVAYPIVCRTLITSEGNTTVAVTTVSKQPVVTFFDGGSSRAPVVGQYSGQRNDTAIFLSSGKKMLFQATLAPNSQYGRLNFSSRKEGGLVTLTGQKTIHLVGSADISFPVQYQIQAPKNQRVRFDLSGSTLTASNNVSVFDGPFVTKPFLVFSNTSAYFPLTTTSNQLIVTVAGLSKNDSLSLSVAPVSDDCNGFSGNTTGTLVWKSSNKTECNWVVRPNIEKYVVMVQLQAVSLCAGGNLTLFKGLSDQSPVLSSYNSASQTAALLPVYQIQSRKGLRLKLSSCKSSLSQVKARYWTQSENSVCSPTILGKSGSLSSPNFPDQYPLNSRCNWTFPAMKNSYVFVTLKTLDLNSAHNLTLIQKLQNHTNKAVATGTSLPTMDWIYDNTKVSLNFSASAPKVNHAGQGFSLDYKIIMCGGSLNNVTGKAAVLSLGKKAMECIWIIQLPQSKKYNSSVQITFPQPLGKGSTLMLRDGGSRRSPIIYVDLKKNKTVLSRTRILWMNFTYTLKSVNQSLSAAAGKFSFTYTQFTCKKSNQCVNSGQCIHPDWRCNGADDCGDNTDEKNCPPQPPSPAKPKNGVAKYWIPLCLLFGLILGIVLAFLIPAIYRRLRYPHYSHLRESVDTPT